MQDDCLDVSNKPFYKRRKQLIPPPRGVSFSTSKFTLMLTGAYIMVALKLHQLRYWTSYNLCR